MAAQYDKLFDTDGGDDLVKSEESQSKKRRESSPAPSASSPAPGHMLSLAAPPGLVPPGPSISPTVAHVDHRHVSEMSLQIVAEAMNSMKSFMEVQAQRQDRLEQVMALLASGTMGAPAAPVQTAAATSAPTAPPAPPATCSGSSTSRGSSLAPPPASAPAAPTSFSPEMLQKIVEAPEPIIMDKVPQSIQKHIQKVTWRFEESILRSFKAEAAVLEARKDLEILAEGIDRFPPGIRPFKSPAAATELDDPAGTPSTTSSTGTSASPQVPRAATPCRSSTTPPLVFAEPSS